MKNNKEQTTMRWWGGLRTIGGNIVSLEYQDSRLIFDFGFIPHPNSIILGEKVKTRTSRFVHDYVSLEVAPAIDGIYEEEDVEQLQDLQSVQEDGKKTAVLVSHLHLDHIGSMGMLSPQIPIFLTEDSFRLYQALEVIGEGVRGYQPNLQACTYEESFQVGNFIVTPIQVDHDIPGACGFHIETPDGNLFYMGDFRMHGNHPERVEAAIQSVKERGVDIFMMEGTTLSDLEQMRRPLVPDPCIPDRMKTEADVPMKMRDILEEFEGIGIFNMYHRNVERLESILALKGEMDRTIVLEPETAYIADKLIDATDFSIYLSSETKEESMNNKMSKWKEELLQKYNTIDATIINQHPREYFLQNSYENVLELLDLQVKDGVYLHSNAPPLGNYDPSYQHLLRLLKYLGLKRIYVGSGGHALAQHLKYVLEKINPDTFIPMHSFHPERLVPDHARLVLPEYGVTYMIKNGHVIRSMRR